MNNTFLIPANSKKSSLMFGVFTTIDLWIFLTGITLSFLLLMFLPVNEFHIAVITLIPGFMGSFLVFPIPNYHNVRTVIMNAWNFYTTRQRYIWKGWCFNNGETSQE